MPTTRRAADVAADISELVRELNYATLPADGYPGLTWVADAYEVLALLREASARLQQALGQSGAFLTRALVRGDRLLVSTGDYAGDPHAAILQAQAGLYEAGRLADELGQLLDRSAQAIAWVAHDDPDPDAA